MKKDIIMGVALCGASFIAISSVTSLIKERKEIKDVLAKQNYAIKTLVEQVNNLQFVAETADNGKVFPYDKENFEELA